MFRKRPRGWSVDLSQCSALAMCTVARDRAASASSSRRADRMARCSRIVRPAVSSWAGPRRTEARVVGPDRLSSREHGTESPEAAAMPRWKSGSQATSSATDGFGRIRTGCWRLNG